MERYYRIIKPFLKQRVETYRALKKVEMEISAKQIKFSSQAKMESIMYRDGWLHNDDIKRRDCK